MTLPHSAASRLFVCGLEQMPGHVRRLRPRRLVSLLPPGEQPETPRGIAGSDHLRLEMDDVTEPAGAPLAPSRGHIETLLRFVRGSDPSSSLLFHCMAGISRSTAAALIAMVENAPGHEAEAATLLREAAPHARPNRLMIAIADEVLGRDGRLIAALDAIPPWDPEAEPSLISLPRSAAASGSGARTRSGRRRGRS